MKAEPLNAMIHARIRESADRRAPRNPDEARQRRDEDVPKLKKALGLFPDLPRTPLNESLAKSLQRDGYRIDIVRFESRPGWPVVAHVYVPHGEGRFPAVVQTHAIWPNQTREPWVQARGISLALSGIVSVHIAPPGQFEGLDASCERANLGDPNAAWAHAGVNWMGMAVWDLVRAADWLNTQPYVDIEKLAIVGDGVPGEAAWFAFAIEERFKALGALFNAESWQHVLPAHARWEVASGLAELGDASDLLALRAPAPVFVAGVEVEGKPSPTYAQTFDELKRRFAVHKADAALRCEAFSGDPDVHRRVRESLLAFLNHHLKGEPARPYAPEPRPITDGRMNAYPGWTEPADSPDLLSWVAEPATTIETRIDMVLDEGFPEAHPAADRLIPWGRYGRVELPKVGVVVRLQDAGGEDPAPDVVVLPVAELDLASLHHVGLSAAEFFAQVLHLALPGGPEGWESAALGSDALTSMIASMKTLVGKSDAEPVRRLEATGPVASAAAAYLKLLRPELEVVPSQTFGSFRAMRDTGLEALEEPQARYRTFPFAAH